MNRRDRKAQAEGTVRALGDGRYVTASGANVEFRHALDEAVRGTRLYTPDAPPPPASPGTLHTQVEVVNETTLAGARALLDAGENPAALNFASAKNPGGGFLGGSEAQEESLARASGLYACLRGSPYYDFHRAQRDPVYSDHMIVSPSVPVIRDDEGALLEAPWPCTFVTSPAVNRGALKRPVDVAPIMRSRLAKVLDAFAAHGCVAIVLGAWGCGVFRNDPTEIAELFAEALRTTHRGVFSRVRFSVLDRGDRGTYRAFARAL